MEALRWAAARTLSGGARPRWTWWTQRYADAMHEPIDDETFEDWVLEAIDTLPEVFRDQLSSVAIVIEGWPSAEQLASTGAPGLFGLYQGIPRSRLSADAIAAPSRITLFRGTLEAHYRTPETLKAKVMDTVRHELAHHLGISDARLHELEQERRGGR